MRALAPPTLLAAAGLAVAIAAGCSDTADLVVIHSDRAAQIDHYCVAVGAAGQWRYAERFDQAGHPLPQSLTVFAGSQAGAFAAARADTAGQTSGYDDANVSFQSGATGTTHLSLDACPRSRLAQLTFEPPAMVGGSPAARGALALGPDGGEVVLVDGSSATAVSYKGAMHPAPAPPAGTTALWGGDLDGDCLPDLVVLATGTAVLWRGTSDGGFSSDPAAIPAGAAAGAAIGDVNGDGAADLILCGGAAVRELVSSGRSLTEVPGAVTFDPADPIADATACLLGDFDGDGHLDLVVAQGSPAQPPSTTQLFLNDAMGTGHFGFVAGLPPLPGHASALAAADTDGDGHLDLFVAHSDSTVHLYVNGRGDGFLEDRSFAKLPPADPLGNGSTNTPSLTAADLDGDCAVDLVAPRVGAPPRIWKNDGTGGFVEAAALPIAGDAFGVDVRDVSSDGVQDLLLYGGSIGAALLKQVKP